MGRVGDISCACEEEQGAIPSMFAVCNMDYVVDISSSDRIAREPFGERAFWNSKTPFLKASRIL